MIRTCPHFRHLLSVLCVAVGLSSNSAITAAEPLSKPPNKVFHQMVMQRLEGELNHMQLSMRISDDQTQLLREAGETELIRWTKRQNPKALFGVKGVPTPVLDAVMLRADRRLGLAVANRYRKDVALEKKLNRAIGVDGFVVILDQALSLSEEQETQLRQLATDNWQSQWLNRVLTSGPERINILRPALSEFTPQLKRILTPLQFRTLKTKYPSSARSLMANMEPSKIHSAAESFRKKNLSELEGVIAVRIDELKRLCDLDSSQVVAFKKTGQKVTEELANALGKAFEEIKVKGPGGAAPNAWNLVSSNLYLLVERDSNWQAAVQHVLTADQRETWHRRQANRRKRWSESAIGGIAALLGQQLRFTAQQTADFMKVLRDEIDVEDVWSTNDHYRELAKINDDSFDGLFSDKQRIELSSVIENLRKQ